ncbi:MAG: ribosome maturation factor RimP [Defluviitaleaceae bacterium]|nr:ribosome maturation factor RimP [Defluviitaleaceae bacterium]
MAALTKEVEKRVEALAAPICAELGISLWDVVFTKEVGNWYLRVFVDKDGGVAVDDCVATSRKLEKLLDEQDFIEPAYMLEVSSPGIDRPLKRPSDFEKYMGDYVDIKLYKAHNKVKNFQGKLRGQQDGILKIEIDGGELLEFELAKIASCRVAVMF